MDSKFFMKVILILIVIFAVSCSSAKGVKRISGEAVMYGMVYNSENIPVVHAEVIVDGKTVIYTDAQGRFILSSKQRKDFTLSLAKAGYETVTGTFRFEPMEVIHTVMVNAGELLKQAEYAMDEARYNDVIKLCDRALDLSPDRFDVSYLKALSLIRLKEYGRARYILTELQKNLGEREYISRVLEGIPAVSINFP